MRIIIVSFVLLTSFSSLSMAIPYLQLDIFGGAYDTSDESIYTDANQFTLYAFAKTGDADVYDEDGNFVETKNFDAQATLDDTFYLSIALVPKSPTTTDFGSFDINTITKDTNDMTYGTPPSLATVNPDHIGPHGIFDTLYYEQVFQFDLTKYTKAYNTQDNPGGALLDFNIDEMFYMDFELDVTNMGSFLAGVDALGNDIFEDYELHFDLYNLEYKEANNANQVDGYARGSFAPFSHDAKTVPGGGDDQFVVPEPSTLILLGVGLVGLAAYRRKKH